MDQEDPAIGYTKSLFPKELLMGQKEKEENKRMADYLDTLAQYGGGSRRRNKTRKKRYKFY